MVTSLTRSYPILLGLVLLVAIGCSGSNAGGEPVSPGLSGDQVSVDAALANRILWGVWHVSLDAEAMTAEVVPVRNAEFTGNVMQFMQPPASPTHMVGFAVDPSSVPEDGYFVVDVTLKHPFPGLNVYNGFDVRGILYSDGSITGEHDSSVVRTGPDDTHLLNADGYTRWWNWQEFTTYGKIFGATQGGLAPPNHPTATVNGYKYFADGLGLEEPVTSLDPSSRGFFTTADPGVNTRRYEIQFKMDGDQVVFDFNYAVDASWDEPDKSYEPDYPVEAFSVSANCHEAFHVDVTDAGSTAWYVDGENHGGQVVLDLEVFDWQGGAKSDVPSEIAGIYLEGEILDGVVDVVSSATVVPGNTVNSAIYEVTIGELSLTSAGDFELFGTVESADPTTYEPQIVGGNAFDYPDSPLSAFFTCSVTVLDESLDPAPVVTGIDPDEGFVGSTAVHVTITGENFVDGAVFRLERDGETDIEADSITWVDEYTLEGDLNLDGALLGLWDVTVENPDNQTGTLEDGFTVIESPYPSMTGIDPDEGIPDCTPEHVTITGEDFVDGATFRLERDGEPDIEAENVEWIDGNTLEGDLDLLNVLPGLWDLRVENPGGKSDTLEDAFTVLEVLYVDGDNAGDPGMDGTKDHPFDTIQKGLDAAYASNDEAVIVDQCAIPYSTFDLYDNSHVIGCNWNDGVGWPTVEQNITYTYGSNDDNVTVDGLFLDIEFSSGEYGMRFIGGDGIAITRCKFSGVINTHVRSLTNFSSCSNVEISYSEFTEIFHRADDSASNYMEVVDAEGVNGLAIHHCELHDIGFDQHLTGNNYTIIRLIRTRSGTRRIDFHNLLIYDIFDKTDGLGDRQNALSVFHINGGSGEYMKLYNMTIDNVRQADPPSSTTVESGHVRCGEMWGIDAIRTWKNNIVSNIIPTDDNVNSGTTSYCGWIITAGCSPPPYPATMDNSAVYNVARPLPPGEGSNPGWYYGWANGITYGIDCIYNYEDNDPAYDLTPGPNFYHPTNPDYAQGGDDGGEMGAFGGPEGDWTPPSQL